MLPDYYNLTISFRGPSIARSLFFIFKLISDGRCVRSDAHIDLGIEMGVFFPPGVATSPRIEERISGTPPVSVSEVPSHKHLPSKPPQLGELRQPAARNSGTCLV